ncbi:MAG: RHS repeat-associated core domain-containing protein, partial [Verrucomicrobiales bacterium]|nr:RHS repeat-associated core domain-containing protein [Verrucomicrobiales bacterium]
GEGAWGKPFVRRSYLWGEDLAGSVGGGIDPTGAGAGGVGGLLAMTWHDRGAREAESYWVTQDLNGNVIGLLSTTTTKTAVYDYDPFGNPMRVNEPEPGLNPVRFSGKYTDAETGMCYYGFRFYEPESGRWLSRGPIGEKGGLSLYGMVGNDAVNNQDILGLSYNPKKFCCCKEFYVDGGLQNLKAQAQALKIGIDDGFVGQALRERFCGDGKNGPSCKNNHRVLINFLKVPPCWRCWVQCGYSTSETRQHPLAAGLGDHCVVFCSVLFCEARADYGQEVVRRIILDITGGVSSQALFSRLFPNPHEDTFPKPHFERCPR